MAKTKWYQKGIYLLIALALALSSGLLVMPRAAASPDQTTFYSSASDGELLCLRDYTEGYTAAHDASTSAVYDNAWDLGLGQDYTYPGWYQIRRVGLFFDTSSLPDDACITSATLSLYGTEDHSDTDFLITVVNGTGLHEPLENTDYGYLRSQTVSGGSFSTSGFNASGYNDIPLNAAGMGWISKTGTTKFGLRSSRDITPTEPSGLEYVDIYASEQGAGYQPRLVVTYTTPPVAVFNATPTSGCAPLTVNFSDQSTGNITSWNWTFGDGGTSNASNPSHNYTSPGTYNVTLTVVNDCGQDTETKTAYITVRGLPTADFTATPSSGCAPLTVQFTDQSTGSPTSWNWTFGDGGTSSDQDPYHRYVNAGTYNVSLTASSDCGSNSSTRTNFITVSEAPPVGGEAYPVNKLAILAPWIALAVLLAGGAGWLALRRRRAQS